MNKISALIDEATQKLHAEAKRRMQEINTIEQRHREELDPLREQLAELQSAIARIEGGTEPTTPSTGRRAGRGQNKGAILAALDRTKGRTAAEISDTTGVPKATVHATLHKLASDGVVKKTRTDAGVLHTLV